MAGATRTTRRSGKTQEPEDAIPLRSGPIGAYVDNADGRSEESPHLHSSVAIASEYPGEVEPLGEHVNEAITLISKLEGIGLAKFDIPLPKCVVLGEQSTGKSSVIEAISGIKTPRSTGTCTRCVLFIKMEPAANPNSKWHGRVLLRKSFIYHGNMSLKTQYPGWSPQNTEEREFASTDSPDVLEELIARAQMATLSPQEDPLTFIHGSLTSLRARYMQTEFSPNVICIQVSGPGFPALSFYDLPGIIGQSEDAESHFLVKFVRDLVISFIKDQDALVLVTCSLGNDIHNSSAAGIARDHKAVNRCIGVLTKPDCLPTGDSLETLKAVFEGQKFALGHNYFVVKNLSQEKLSQGLSHREARIEEQEFFKREAPWSTTFAPYKDRFGTHALQSYLAKKLGAQTLSTLPIIHETINNRLQQVEVELNKLPESPFHNAIHIATDVLRKFTSRLEKEIDAEIGYVDWRGVWDMLRTKFAARLEDLRPKFHSGGSRDNGLSKQGGAGSHVDDSIVLDSSDEDNEADIMSEYQSQETTGKKRKLDSATPSGTPAKSKHQGNAEGISAHSTDLKHLRKLYRLDEVAVQLKQLSKSKIPDRVQPKVIEKMTVENLKHWEHPLSMFFKELEFHLKRHVFSVFEEEFAEWSDSKIYPASRKIVDDLINAHLQEQRFTMAAEALNDEQDGPYMFHEVHSKEKDEMLKKYEDARFRTRKHQYFKEMEAATGKSIPPRDRDNQVSKDSRLQGLLKSDPYKTEVDVIAQITSYYAIASRRFHDSVCMRIDSKFFKFLRKKVYGELIAGLQVGGEKGHAHCVELLAEPPHRRKKRERLIEEKNALLQGQKCLNELASKCMDGHQVGSPGWDAVSSAGRSFSASATTPSDD